MTLIETPRNKVLDDQIRTAIALTAQQLSTKVRLQTFDPDAIDGDGDGFVQDGTPFMRPAVISAIANASQRLGKILSRAATLNKSGRAREYQRRYAGMSASDIAKDAVPDSLEAWAGLAYERMRIKYPEMPPLSPDMTPFERDNAIRALEDYVEDDLKWMLSPEKAKEFDALKKTDRTAAFKMLLEGAFDFSPEAVAKNRELVEHALTTNPEFRALVEKFGLPSIVKYGPNMDSSHMAAGVFNDSMGIALKRIKNPRSKGRADRISRGLGKWFMTGIIEPDIQSKKTKRWTTSEAPEALLIQIGRAHV